MEQAEQLEINIETIGVILKNARLKKKKSLADISNDLCIRKIYLSALEESDFTTLPPVPYGLGYVKSYAQYLGFDINKAIELYKSETQANSITKESNTDLSAQPNKSSKIHIIIGFILVLLIYTIWSIATSVHQNEEISEEINEPFTSTEKQIVILENEYYVEENVQTNDVQNDNIEVKKEEEILLQEEKIITDNKVRIEILGESWIELKGKNKKHFSGIFNNGDIKEIDFEDNLIISVGRPKNIKLFVNGQEKDIIKTNKKMNISIDSL